MMQAANALRDMDGQIIALCEANGLENYLQPLDFGIVDLMYNWAYGDSLSEVLEHSDMTGGDFVRTAKRIADVLQQIAVAEPYLGRAVPSSPPSRMRPTSASIVASWLTPAWTDRRQNRCQTPRMQGIKG